LGNHDYSNSTLIIPLDSEWNRLINKHRKETRSESQLLMENKETSWGDSEPPSRQVLSPKANISEHVDKQEPPETTTFITEHETLKISKSSKPIPARLGISWNPLGGRTHV
jgi:hypothetical protein